MRSNYGQHAINALTVLGVGVAIVIGGILLLRLHAFLALLLAGLTAGLLTPSRAIERYEVEKHAISIATVDDATLRVTLELPARDAAPGSKLLLLRVNESDGSLRQIGALEVLPVGEDSDATVARIERLDQGLAAHNSDVVVTSTVWQQALVLAQSTVGERVAAAFGSTCGKIGILIAMAAIIGKCLLDSGAADKIVRFALRLFGEPRAPVAFIGSGFVLGIPVFFDTVFYLMIPLGKALGVRTGRNYLLYVLTIVAGATMAHSLVPPTPGPLFVAEELGVDVGLMMLAGSLVGLVTVTYGYLHAVTINRFCELPLRDSPDFSLSDLQRQSEVDESQLPPLWMSLVPILLPVVLIGGLTVLKMSGSSVDQRVMNTAKVLGNKNIALVISAALAMAMLAWRKRTSRRELAQSVQSALASGGVIILITAAGGAFGQMIQQTGIAGVIKQLPAGSPVLLIVFAFLVTTAVRTAQGSATVAMITAVGVLSFLGDAQSLPFHPVYLALAIGCGSKPIAWMNDSGFWVICQMSGMSEGGGPEVRHAHDRHDGPGGSGRHDAGCHGVPFDVAGDSPVVESGYVLANPATKMYRQCPSARPAVAGYYPTIG